MIKICKPDPSDCDALLSLEERSFNYERLSRRQLRRHLQSATSEMAIARADGVAAGYGLLFFHQRRARARLYSICVDPDFRGRGIARKLMEYLEERARRRSAEGVYLEVREDNPGARNLYEKCGYAVSGKKPDYYGKGIAAVMMTKDFS